MYTPILVLVTLQLITHTFGANILLLSGIASPSHHMYNRVLGAGLAAKHNVTFLSGDLGKTPIPNLHYIHLERVYAAIFEGDDKFDMLEMSRQGPVQQFADYTKYFVQGCKGSLTSKGLDVILNYPDDFKFDVVIHDFTMGFCLLPLLHKFNYPPLISLTAFSNPPFSIFSIGGHKYPAYIPHYLMDYPVVMSFTQRVYNMFLYVMDLYEHRYRMFPEMERLIQERYNFKNMPSGAELELKTALMFINTDYAVEFPEPMQPNMVQIAGLQIAEPKPLKEEMEKFIISAKKGTILMSLGTNMKSAQLGDELLSKIIKTFAQLPDYNFLWKFEEDPKTLPVKPSKNVMIQKFMPQNDILAHPKIVAFVSHSGLLSSHEALYHGTPVIGMPFYADQYSSIAKMIQKGVGAKIDFRTLTTESFKEVILKVVENPKYAENSKKVAKLFQDKPMKPLETALWWVDYVIRNPNLDHMKSPTLETGFFVAYSLDIVLAAVVMLNLLVYIVCKLFKKLFGAGNSKRKTE